VDNEKLGEEPDVNIDVFHEQDCGISILERRKT
jgi:hypothetical protein